MVERRFQTHYLQGTVAADTQHDLLFDAHLQIAAIQLVGDVSIFGAVGRDVGIQQVERHAAHLRPPHLGDDLPAGVRDFDGERYPVRPALQGQGQTVEVVVLINLLLPAGCVEILTEVTLLVEKPHAHQRHPQVTGRF